MKDLAAQLELAQKFVEDNLNTLCAELVAREQGSTEKPKLLFELVELCDWVTENRFLFAERLIQSTAVRRWANHKET